MRARSGDALIPMATLRPDTRADRLLRFGFVHVRASFRTPSEALAVAERIARAAELRSPLAHGMPALVSVGEFVIPPEGAPRPDFQVLHIDFGLPIDPHAPNDVARYSALHVPADWAPTSARTRIVPLALLLSQRKWLPCDMLAGRLVEYGASRGARDGDADYVEGVLARLVEAADEGEASLPSASDCLCGQELESVADEHDHFAARGLRLEAVELLVSVQPGELLVLDNLATAHGRLGQRRENELHQLMLGHRQLGVARQIELRDRVLAAFAQ